MPSITIPSVAVRVARIMTIRDPLNIFLMIYALSFIASLPILFSGDLLPLRQINNQNPESLPVVQYFGEGFLFSKSI